MLHNAQEQRGTHGKRGSPSYTKVGQALSKREYELLVYLANGLLTKEVAHMLGISPETVKNHHTSIYTKLGAKNGPHAVMIAVRKGILGSS